MDKEKIVNDLIVNKKTAWTEDEREYLMGLSEEKLTLHVEAAPKEELEVKEDPKPDPESAKLEIEGSPIKIVPTDNQEETVDEYIENAPEGFRDVLRSGLDAHKAEKAELIEKIVANERNPFNKEELEAKGVSELKQLSTLAEVPQASAPVAPSGAVVNFGGQGEIVPTANQEGDEEVLVAPSVVNAEE